MVVKGAVLFGAFLVANFWMMAVVDSDMDRGVSVGNALKNIKAKKMKAKESERIGGIDDEEESRKHKGLNMFSELAHMSNLFDNDQFSPSWGGRYFAEAANVIPRGLWKNKPLVGVDYALARGFGDDRGKKAGVGGVLIQASLPV